MRTMGLTDNRLALAVRTVGGLHTCCTSPRVIRVGGRAMSENISKEEYALFLSQEGS